MTRIVPYIPARATCVAKPKRDGGSRVSLSLSLYPKSRACAARMNAGSDAEPIAPGACKRVFTLEFIYLMCVCACGTDVSAVYRFSRASQPRDSRYSEGEREKQRKGCVELLFWIFVVVTVWKEITVGFVVWKTIGVYMQSAG